MRVEFTYKGNIMRQKTQTNTSEQKFRYHLQSKLNNQKDTETKHDLYLVDDDEADLYCSSHTLKQSNKINKINEIHESNSPEKLFELLNDHGWFSEIHESVDQLPIILMDIHMPYINGIEMLSLIKEHPIISYLPVILLTSDRSGHKIPDAHRLKARGYLEKPLKINCFHDVLEKIKNGENRMSLGDYKTV